MRISISEVTAIYPLYYCIMQINLLENLDTEENCLVQFPLWRDEKLFGS